MMLFQILKEYRESGGVIDLNDLSRRLGVDRHALDGMLETLVHQGKLHEVGTTDTTGSCNSGSCHGCGHASESIKGCKTYQLVAY
jgi:hypothetical protein